MWPNTTHEPIIHVLGFRVIQLDEPPPIVELVAHFLNRTLRYGAGEEEPNEKKVSFPHIIHPWLFILWVRRVHTGCQVQAKILCPNSTPIAKSLLLNRESQEIEVKSMYNDNVLSIRFNIIGLAYYQDP